MCPSSVVGLYVSRCNTLLRFFLHLGTAVFSDKDPCRETAKWEYHGPPAISLLEGTPKFQEEENLSVVCAQMRDVVVKPLFLKYWSLFHMFNCKY